MMEDEIRSLENEIFILEMKDHLNYDDMRQLQEMRKKLQELKNRDKKIF